jgi:glycerophosphoryl diester phosphodiesterase
MIRKIMTVVFVLILIWVGASMLRSVVTQKGGSASGKMITGHRGGAGLGLENSLDCIAAGMEAGASSIEIDVHVTSDGGVVVCHDPTLDRTTEGKGKINDKTLEQVKATRLLNPYGSVSDQTVPTLEDVLAVLDGKVELLLEIKRKGGNNKGIEQAVLEILKKHDALEYTVIQSFDDSVLETLHALDPSLRLEKLLFCKFIGVPVIFDGTFSVFSKEKYSYIRSFNFFNKALSASLSSWLHDMGYRTRIWTLDDPASIPQCQLDGIITDRPDLFTK